MCGHRKCELPKIFMLLHLKICVYIVVLWVRHRVVWHVVSTCDRGVVAHIFAVVWVTSDLEQEETYKSETIRPSFSFERV